MKPPPDIAPIVSRPADRDRDGTFVDDRLEDTWRRARARLLAAPPAGPEFNAALRELSETVEVEVILSRPVREEDLAAFERAGGQVGHIYAHVSYGWTGSITLSGAVDLPAHLGGDLLGVVAGVEAVTLLDEATRNARVRPAVWARGLDGASTGVVPLAVGILDTGVDATHTDLAARGTYWADWTIDNELTPVDYCAHGTHVAGVAVGSGASAGVNPATLSYVQVGTFPATIGDSFKAPVRIPDSVSSLTWSSALRWSGAGGGTVALSHDYPDGAAWVAIDSQGGIASLGPTTLTTPGLALPHPALSSNRRFTSLVTRDSGSGAAEYALQITKTYAGVGDGYESLRGVAPGARWAGFKIFRNTGTATSIDIDEAIDDLVAQRVAHNIRAATFSFAFSGTPGISITTRNKTNTAALNGIVVCTAAGNGGRIAGGGGVIGDPGRAEYSITAVATSDVNRLTDYSSRGFAAPGDAFDGDDDTKPDLAAPGGSDQETRILAADSNWNDARRNDGANFADAVANDYYNNAGTSMAAPVVAGSALLLIEAMERAGEPWAYTGAGALARVFRVKCLLLMTATETNLARETGGVSPDPALGREVKDEQEGYGVLNVDAAVDAVLEPELDPSGFAHGETFGTGPFDRRCWARAVSIPAGATLEANLTVPGGADYDLYLYRRDPNGFGNPVIEQSSVQAGAGVNESITFTPGAPWRGYLVVKRVSGGGAFSLTGGLTARVERFAGYE